MTTIHNLVKQVELLRNGEVMNSRHHPLETFFEP